MIRAFPQQNLLNSSLKLKIQTKERHRDQTNQNPRSFTTQTKLQKMINSFLHQGLSYYTIFTTYL